MVFNINMHASTSAIYSINQTIEIKSPVVSKVGPTILVVTDLEGHPRLIIFISSERVYATSY